MSTPVIDRTVRAEPDIRWAASTFVERGVVAAVLNATADTVHWGDGTKSQVGGAPVRHTYRGPGAYWLTATRGSAVVAAARVYVRNGLTPDVEFTTKPEAPNVIVMTVGRQPPAVVHPLTIDWGDDSPLQTGTWLPGAEVRHPYRAGTYTVTVQDHLTGRSGEYRVTATARVDDPGFTVAQGADTMTAELTVTHLSSPGKSLIVDWGDFSQTTIPAAQVGAKVPHTFDKPDDYLTQLVYADGSTDGSADLITVPFPEPDDTT